ncbi:hypothetical protein [Streptomyces sp. NPDC005799]|uniref:hypothetical protein n=1 Tax=Streptomyces sp. NPDC005799 TaxID=3154678 RepID=UPI0033FEFB6C
MATNDPAPPTETTLILLIAELTAALERLTASPSSAELEITAFPPAKAAELLGKTPNWVVEAIQDDRVPHTYIGKSPRMTADHIRQVIAEGERKPNKYSKTAAA